MAMDVSTIERVIDQVGNEVAAMVGVLAPIGQSITLSLTVLAVIAMGCALAQGASIAVGTLLRVTAAATLTNWAISQWDTIARGTVQGSRQIIGMLIPGYAGPSTLLDMAMTTSARIEAEQMAFSYGGIGEFITGHLMGLIAPAFVFLGLSAIGLLAILAEVLLLLGASIAPLLLPFLAFTATASIGWGPLRFLLQSSIRIIMLGGVNHLMAKAITAVVIIPLGTDGLRHEDMYALMGLSLLCFLVAWCVNGVARDSAGGGGPTSMGMGAMTTVGGYTVAMGSGAAGAIGAGAKGGAAAARGAISGGKAAGAAMGSMGRSSDRAFN